MTHAQVSVQRVFESPRSRMRLGFFFFSSPRIVLESEAWEEIYLTPLRPVRLLVWTRTRWGGSSSCWRFLGWDLGGHGGRDTDFRIDRWSSFVWPVGYAKANSETFISTLMWDCCQQWTEREDKRSSASCFSWSSWLQTQPASQIDPFSFSH